MNNGIVVFAHNSREVDYALLSTIAAGFAKTALDVPVSLIIDQATLEWTEKSNIHNLIKKMFDKIILTQKPNTQNTRNLYDGTEFKTVPFINSNRASVWELTPYDRTLLIDSDFLIQSPRLSEFWEIDQDILISEAINDINFNNRIGYHDRYISDTGIKMYWATAVMFTKNEKSKIFFDLVNHIQTHYNMYGDIYRFNPTQYRNDIAFSIAKHMLDGFENADLVDLPPILTAIDKDVLYDVDKTGLKFLISEYPTNDAFAINLKGADIHIMNKQSIIRHSNKLLEIVT